MRRWAAYVWAGTGSLLGLALIAMARAGVQVRRVEGVIEAWGGDVHGIPARFVGDGLEAITLGHVILARDEASLERYREHERVHVRQWERWGPLFLLAYPAASLWASARGRAAYRGNRFEREARQVGPRA